MKSYNISQSFFKLFDYVKRNNYEGIDLFDGLNSKLFKNSFLYKYKYFRLALIQFCKLSPIDFRKILMVPKGFNPKAGALFLLGNINMYKATKDEIYRQEAQKLYTKLKEYLIERKKGIGWGYNFDWQARAFFVPQGTPNIVTSVYVGKALLEYYRIFQEDEALQLAGKIAEFILSEMILFESNQALCFRYIPNENTQVHNANLLAASYLSSIEKYTHSTELKNKILKAVNYSISDINTDGSFPYGTLNFHRWVDNFHTAFNIESLLEIRDNLNASNLDCVIEKVVEYYLENLFTDDGLPKYFNNKLYPIDIHVLAEVIIVLNKRKTSKLVYDETKLEIIEFEVLNLLKLFQDKKGYFYYQNNRFFMNKIPYIRWGQAWMFFALSTIIYKDTNL